MKNPEATYITLGYKYEKAETANAARAFAETIRSLLQGEHLTDQPEARRLIEQGRQEARMVAA
jgi:esterase/lipase superfamily enzyme